MTNKLYGCFKADDGSIAVKKQLGGKWSLFSGSELSKAAKFRDQQNKFWKSWMIESVFGILDDGKKSDQYNFKFNP